MIGGEVVLDVDELRAELARVTDEALTLGEALAVEVTRHSSRVFRMARELQEKHLELRRIRRAIKAEVSG